MCRNCAQMYAKWDKPQSTIHFIVATHRERILLCAFANENRTDTQGTRIASESGSKSKSERHRARAKKINLQMGKGKRHAQNEKRSERKKPPSEFSDKIERRRLYKIYQMK